MYIVCSVTIVSQPRQMRNFFAEYFSVAKTSHSVTELSSSSHLKVGKLSNLSQPHFLIHKKT